MKQLKLFYRFFLITIWLGMVNPFYLQAQEVYFFEDFETAGGDVWEYNDHLEPPEGWTTHVLSENGNPFTELFRFTLRINNKYPPYPMNGTVAEYDSKKVTYNNLPDNSSLESSEFDLPTDNSLIFLSFHHQFDYWTDNANGVIELWNGEEWLLIYDVGSKDIGWDANILLSKTVIEHINITEKTQGLLKAKIRLRFYHESGGDRGSWWKIDNVKIHTPPSIDIGTTALQHTELPYHCYKNDETVEVQIKNYGSQALDFSKQPLTIALQTQGSIEHIYHHTLETGFLDVEQTQTFSISGINLSEAGAYTLQTYPILEGNQLLENDTTRIYRTTTKAQTLPFPTLNFDEYTWQQASEDGWNASENDLWIGEFVGDFPNGMAQNQKFTGNERNCFILTPLLISSTPLEFSFDIALKDAWGTSNPEEILQYLQNSINIHTKISTDCGQSFTTLQTIDVNEGISTNKQTERIKIEGYEEQEVMIGIFMEATRNEDFDEVIEISLDNISIQAVLARNIGVEPTDDFVSGFYNDYDFNDFEEHSLWACGDFHYPIRLKLINHGTILQNNFEVLGKISYGTQEDFSLLITEPLYPAEERIVTLGTANTHTGGQYDFNAYIKLPNDDDHSNDTLNAFLIALPKTRIAEFTYEQQGNGTILFSTHIRPGNPQYFWDFGDGKGNSTFRSPSYTYEANAAYDVTLIVTDDCGSNSYTETVVVDTVVSIEDFDLEQILSITPNPSSDSFVVRIEGRTIPKAHIQVFSANGQVVFAKNYTNFQEAFIFLDKYPQGTYHLQFKTEQKTINHKLLLSK